MASWNVRMTDTSIVLKDVSFLLPDGSPLFTDICEQFDHRHTGIVGRNGVGKSVLARILAGLLPPTSGVRRCAGRVHYLAQQVTLSADQSVAGLAGVADTLAALRRIESGSVAADDFDMVGDDWDLPQRLQQALEREQVGYLTPDVPANALSGGEAMRVSLLGATLSNADFLILDEPSNHLDRDSRRALIEQLRCWQRGLIVVSHDRRLLESMARIVELSPAGLANYGGNYSFYAAEKEHERQSALEHLHACKAERQRQRRAAQAQLERVDRRQARGGRQGKQANQAKILLDRQKERSEASSGALRRKQAASDEQLTRRVHDAARQVEAQAQVVLHAQPVDQPTRRRVAELADVQLPWVSGPAARINLLVRGQQRMGVVGPNGVGKSTALRVLAGQLEPLAGTCWVTPEMAYLDQSLRTLDPERSVWDQLRSVNRTAAEGELRTRLAQLGLDGQRLAIASCLLGGGERVKAALACLLYADVPPRLLLLDEPGNHLDLPSLQGVEEMLRSYRGAMLVVSHDDAFLHSLGLTDWLRATEDGWCSRPA